MNAVQEESPMVPFPDRRKNKGGLMNVEAVAAIKDDLQALRNEFKADLEVSAMAMRRDFWRACFGGVIAVFVMALLVAWRSSDIATRVEVLERIAVSGYTRTDAAASRELLTTKIEDTEKRAQVDRERLRERIAKLEKHVESELSVRKVQ